MKSHECWIINCDLRIVALSLVKNYVNRNPHKHLAYAGSLIIYSLFLIDSYFTSSNLTYTENQRFTKVLVQIWNTISFTITYTLYKNDYKSKLSSLSKKSKRPIVSIPSSFRRGIMWSFTMITFLKESLMFVNGRDSCISFSLSGMDKTDCT